MCVATVVLAAATYVPSFMTKPGLVADDSKQYLYLDPGKLIQSAMSMWNPDVGMGTVTHQNIGFLSRWVPITGSSSTPHPDVGRATVLDGEPLLLRRCRRLLPLQVARPEPVGPDRGGAAYTFTPFVIDYIARISAIVMPWAALGWMVGLVIPLGPAGWVAISRLSSPS